MKTDAQSIAREKCIDVHVRTGKTNKLFTNLLGFFSKSFICLCGNYKYERVDSILFSCVFASSHETLNGKIKTALELERDLAKAIQQTIKVKMCLQFFRDTVVGWRK